VAFFRNEAGSPLPGEAVAARGGVPVDIPAYRMVPCKPPGIDAFESMWEDCGLDAVVFGSAALAAAWEGRAPPPKGAALVAWGETCAAAVERRFGRKPVVMRSSDHRGLVEALDAVYEEVAR